MDAKNDEEKRGTANIGFGVIGVKLISIIDYIAIGFGSGSFYGGAVR